MKNRALLSAFLVSLAAPTLTAQTKTTTGEPPISFPGGDRDNGRYAATILSMAISPRAVGVSEAMGAVEGDPQSMFYNAAGIARLKTNSFSVTGSQRFGQSALAGATVTFPTPIGTFGVAARALYAGSIERTDNFIVGGGRDLAYQMSLEGGGAIELAKHWLWGGSLFYSQETLAQDTRGTIGINSGMMFPDILFNRVSLGTGIRNWGTPVTFDSLSARPPLMWYGAAAIDLLRRRNLIQTPMLFRGQPIVADAKIVGQFDVPQHLEPFFKLGLEGTVNGVAIGRLGYMWGDDNRAGISLGGGVNVGQFRLEYSFRNRKNAGADFFSFDPVGDEHHVGASFFWGGPEKNEPVVPVIVTQAAPIDTAAINRAIRDAISREMEALRPLLDSLRTQGQVEIRREEDLVARYIVPVHFGFDSAVVREIDFAILGQVADVIRRIYPTALVTIEGFADPAGSDQYNRALSKRRAEAVKDVMVRRFSLPSAQFRTVGYGEQFDRQVQPGARRDDPGAESNRRVTFTIDATQRFR